MNSFSTSDDTKEYLSKSHGDLIKERNLELVQNKSPKIDVKSLEPISFPQDPELEWQVLLYLLFCDGNLISYCPASYILHLASYTCIQSTASCMRDAHEWPQVGSCLHPALPHAHAQSWHALCAPMECHPGSPHAAAADVLAQPGRTMQIPCWGCRCPPGHGDIYPSLLGSGFLDSLIKDGIKYLFVSNSDNLGATLDLDLLTYFASSKKSFLMEVRQDRIAHHPHLLRGVSRSKYAPG